MTRPNLTLQRNLSIALRLQSRPPTGRVSHDRGTWVVRRPLFQSSIAGMFFTYQTIGTRMQTMLTASWVGVSAFRFARAQDFRPCLRAAEWLGGSVGFPRQASHVPAARQER
jgi:hypothetical protein